MTVLSWIVSRSYNCFPAECRHNLGSYTSKVHLFMPSLTFQIERCYPKVSGIVKQKQKFLFLFASLQHCQRLCHEWKYALRSAVVSAFRISSALNSHLVSNLHSFSLMFIFKNIKKYLVLPSSSTVREVRVVPGGCPKTPWPRSQYGWWINLPFSTAPAVDVEKNYIAWTWQAFIGRIVAGMIHGDDFYLLSILYPNTQFSMYVMTLYKNFKTCVCTFAFILCNSSHSSHG